ncbi:MAG: MazG nucleotide pyrophosphohydrolase domain-containing protein, partial [Desulfobulbales bacterium]
IEVKMSDLQKKFADFINIVKELRSENGCPWDRKQSPSTLKRYLVEETNELLEAIDSGRHQHIKEELGDLLYLIVLLSQIHSEQNNFAIEDVVEAISTKMIRRHPHVFNNEKIESTEELRKKWLEIKAKEKTGCIHPKKN